MQDKAIARSETPSQATSVEKAIDILFCFDAEQAQLRLTDISDRVGLHKSTVHRLLALLKKKGLIVSDPDSQLYSLGPGVVELSWVVLRQQDLRTVCRPHLEHLHRLSNETVSLYTRMGNKRLCVEELESGQAIKYSHAMGLTAPLHVGAPGKALLAFLPQTELEQLLPTLSLTAITPHTLTNLEQLKAELLSTRKRGYALSHGERSAGASAVAAPIRDWRGKPVAALGVLGPSQRFTRDVLKTLSQQIVQTAQDISTALGYHPQTASGNPGSLG